MFTQEELRYIAYCLGVDSGNRSTDKLKKAIKEHITDKLIEVDHVNDIVRWLEETYPRKFRDMHPDDLNVVIDVVKDYVDENYPRFDEHTMYELVKMFNEEIKEEISELV